MIKIEYLEKEIPVYDITVEDNENFYANGILVHNCAEITLPTKPLTYDGDPLVEKRRIKVKKADFEEFKQRIAQSSVGLPRKG